jgi:hypothetical protein
MSVRTELLHALLLNCLPRTPTTLLFHGEPSQCSTYIKSEFHVSSLRVNSSHAYKREAAPLQRHTTTHLRMMYGTRVIRAFSPSIKKNISTGGLDCALDSFLGVGGQNRLTPMCSKKRRRVFEPNRGADNPVPTYSQRARIGRTGTSRFAMGSRCQ